MCKLLKVAIALGVVYALLVAGLYAAMAQPPERFGQIMKRMPRQMFFILPFKPLWMQARAGSLRVGDQAPDFTLQTTGRTRTVQLSSLRGKPVVLVFGSYT